MNEARPKRRAREPENLDDAEPPAMNEPKPKRRARRFEVPEDAETLTICVGPEEEEFKVRIETITRASKLIESAVRGMENEAGKKIIVLAKLRPDVFKKYLGYLRRANPNNWNLVPYFMQRDAYGKYPNRDDRHRMYAECYVLAEYLEDSAYCEVVLQCIAAALLDYESSPQIINFIWEQAAPASRLRKLMLEFWATKPLEVTMRRLRAPENDFPKAFCLDFFEHLLKSHNLTISQEFHHMDVII